MVSAFWLSKTRPGAAQDRPEFVCLSVCLQHFFCSTFFDDFCEEFICNFRKNTLKKGDPGRRTTPNVTRFRIGHLAEVVALSSSGDCGATPLSVCLVATLRLSPAAPPAPVGSF